MIIHFEIDFTSKQYVMKKLLFLVFFAGLFSFADAQVVELELQETEKSMSQGLNPASVFVLENCKRKDVEKSWSKFMKQYGKKTKKVKKSDDYMTDNATIGGMSNNTVDVYAAFDQKGDGVEVAVWFDLGGAYLTSTTHADRFSAAETMLNKFANRVAKEGVENELNAQEKTLKSLNGDLKSLQKKKNSLESDIAKYEKKIEEAKADIEQNLSDQESKTEAIKAQEEVVEEVKKRLKKF